MTIDVIHSVSPERIYCDESVNKACAKKKKKKKKKALRARDPNVSDDHGHICLFPRIWSART